MELILVNKQVAAGVAQISLNRPKELNALNPQLMGELLQALQDLDQDSTVRAIVLTGSDQAFAAGADIRQMAGMSAIDMVQKNQFQVWDDMVKISKPILAAVSGYALGGGCELAMMCDLIIASETAKFGQPEVKIGTIPGAGGTQRLTRAVGKAKAMELILSGRFLSASEAIQFGLVARVCPVESYLSETITLATEIAAMPPIAVRLAKEAVNEAYESSLSSGIAFERRNFYLTFASADQKEGMQAFIEKRKPNFTGK
ncbi:MAG: enoyl-CoA hydratase-related protein [Cyclobacteriaceae bacterium]